MVDFGTRFSSGELFRLWSKKGESSFEGEDCKCFFKAFLERVFTVLGLFGWLIYINHGFNHMLIDVLKLFFVFWRNLPNSKLETQLII